MLKHITGPRISKNQVQVQTHPGATTDGIIGNYPSETRHP